MEIVYMLAGLSIGFLLSFLVFKFKSKSIENSLLVQRSEFEKQEATMEERLNNFQTENQNLIREVEDFEERNLQQIQQLARSEVEFANFREKLQVQKQEMEELQKRFTLEFENIAHKILEQHSEKFTAANQKNIGEVLNPLKEKIQLFEKKVDDTYRQGLKDQTDLRAELN